MPITNRQTPGVYITEINAFPNSVVQVPTAIPAFIGYTARADYAGKSYAGVPVQLTSFADFMTYFGATDATGQALPPLQQYAPVYYTIPAVDPKNADLTIGSQSYDLEPDASTIYYLYNSIRLFYANGGGTCYVVSVGFYGQPTGSPKSKAAPLVNPNVSLADLTAGLATLSQQTDPTLLVIPDAVLLPQADHATLCQAVLAQCNTLQSRMGLFDIWHGDAPDPVLWPDDITAFRNGIGMTGLDYGAAYYPFLKTAISEDSDINYNNLGGAKTLSSILPDAAIDPLKTILATIDAPSGPNQPTPAQSENALLTASPTYGQLHDIALSKINILPTVGAMAGIYTIIDNTRGVWNAPANISPVSVVDTTLHITDTMQAGLNIDPVTGKSINAIRFFNGQGVLVWGARTLDGNSQDWRYISVRRTIIMIEQSIQNALSTFVFAANDELTWTTVNAMISNFLTTLWKEGALQGAKPSDAFSVSVGLGSTMTGEDILQGQMIVSVKLAITHPAEFIVLTFAQQMQTS